jgi:hypothetical protein
MDRHGVMMRLGGWVTVLLALLTAAAPARAHGTSASYIEISVDAERVHVAHVLAADELFAHFQMTRSEPAADGRIHAVPEVVAFLRAHVAILVDGVPLELEPRGHRLHARGAFVRFEFAGATDRPPSAVQLTADTSYFERLGPQHRLFATLAVEDHVHQTVIDRDRPLAAFSTGYRPLLAQCFAFLVLGMEHIFLGYDHLVFLLALLIVGGRLVQLVAMVSAFTVAHSLTLVLAVLQIVDLPSRLVEGAIALTIVYVAFDNFLAPAPAPRWVLTFGLGLVHGLGFATVLREMSLPASQLVPSLVSFNLGVEIGQITVVAITFPSILWLARQRFHRRVVLTASTAILLFGLGLFIRHAFGVEFLSI